MSIDASVSIKLSKSISENIFPIEIIQALLDYGWTFNDLWESVIFTFRR